MGRDGGGTLLDWLERDELCDLLPELECALDRELLLEASLLESSKSLPLFSKAHFSPSFSLSFCFSTSFFPSTFSSASSFFSVVDADSSFSSLPSDFTSPS